MAKADKPFFFPRVVGMPEEPEVELMREFMKGCGITPDQLNRNDHTVDLNVVPD